jgi:ribosomal protein S18 acetylase RimI-like enzyme
MNRIAEFVAYDPRYASQTAQAYLEVFTASPWNETLSLNDALSQLETDAERPGFGGTLIRSAEAVAGFAWWFDVTGRELNDRWRRRFGPKESVPLLEGKGAFLMEFGVLAALRKRGLGRRLLETTLSQIEPTHDWIVLDTSTTALAGLALLKSAAFAKLDLVGIQDPRRICLLRMK